MQWGSYSFFGGMLSRRLPLLSQQMKTFWLQYPWTQTWSFWGSHTGEFGFEPLIQPSLWKLSLHQWCGNNRGSNLLLQHGFGNACACVCVLYRSAKGSTQPQVRDASPGERWMRGRSHRLLICICWLSLPSILSEPCQWLFFVTRTFSMTWKDSRTSLPIVQVPFRIYLYFVGCEN